MSILSFAVGDPQTTMDRFLDAVRGASLLAPSSRLRPGVSLLSMGDHFDFAPPPGWSWPQVSSAGEEILSWLSSHPSDQVTILLGNHDVCRVMEFYRMSDAVFAQARLDGASDVPEADFLARYPDLPSKGIAARDFSAFRVSQRELVQRLLLRGRAQLAAVVETASGVHALATHAGVTERELSQLGLSAERDPFVLAAALNGFLQERVDRVRSAWTSGELVPLDLSPLHLAGVSGAEGGGLLYHRPQTKGTDSWEASGARRYHPRTLPRGLLQVCGHTHHKKCRDLLPVEAGSHSVGDVDGRLRTMWVSSQGVVGYDVGLRPPSADEATVWLIDGRINHSASVELLGLRSIASGD